MSNEKSNFGNEFLSRITGLKIIENYSGYKDHLISLNQTEAFQCLSVIEDISHSINDIHKGVNEDIKNGGPDKEIAIQFRRMLIIHLLLINILHKSMHDFGMIFSVCVLDEMLEELLDPYKNIEDVVKELTNK